mmetsp:Transcript_17502/g.37979  ORF Transcript_17502/g.37979 Transcript_17502/m.37979 type:complete len:353 (-) Transcript_17502:20-1078(-)
MKEGMVSCQVSTAVVPLRHQSRHRTLQGLLRLLLLLLITPNLIQRAVALIQSRVVEACFAVNACATSVARYATASPSVSWQRSVWSRTSARESITHVAAAAHDDDFDNTINQHYGHSWKCYAQYSPLRNQYEKSGGILYRQSVLTQEEYYSIRQELDMLIGKGGSVKVEDEITSSVARNRLGARLPPDCKIVRILSNPNGSVARLVNEVEGNTSSGSTGSNEMVLSKHVPVEVRIYEKSGAGMEWHSDDILFDPAQVEVVLTVENSSDCVTMWEDVIKGSDTAKRVEVETCENSAILIKAGGARHRVAPLRNGRRVILKFVFIKDGATFIVGAEKHINQFAASRTKKRGKKK